MDSAAPNGASESEQQGVHFKSADQRSTYGHVQSQQSRENPAAAQCEVGRAGRLCLKCSLSAIGTCVVTSILPTLTVVACMFELHVLVETAPRRGKTTQS